MSAKGCHHLQTFKKNQKHLNAIRWIHIVFVAGTGAKIRKTKILNSYCRVCQKRGPSLHACIDCVFFGCRRHMREHVSLQNHAFSMDLSYGQLHCTVCNDYVYDAEVDAITMQNKMQASACKKRLFEYNCWDPTEEQRELLQNNTKRLCITAESTIGLRGLINLGQTCFMNCIVQALMHTPLLRDYFLSTPHQCSVDSGKCMICVVTKLFQEFYSGSTAPLVTKDLLRLTWTKNPSLASLNQQDAHEFFISTLNVLHDHYLKTMHNALSPHVPKKKTTKCPCIVDQIFTGALQSDVVCQKCKGISTTNDPIMDFSLDTGLARAATSLEECLYLFTKAENLGNEKDSKIMCEGCKSKQAVTKQLTIKTLPIVISFQLKRFEVLAKKNTQKINATISFPEMLDMTPFISRTKKQSPFPPDNRYCLFAVIVHEGNLDSGHYTAYVRQQENYWYLCDDINIRSSNLTEVLQAQGYMLFYHKQVLEYD